MTAQEAFEIKYRELWATMNRDERLTSYILSKDEEGEYCMEGIRNDFKIFKHGWDAAMKEGKNG